MLDESGSDDLVKSSLWKHHSMRHNFQGMHGLIRQNKGEEVRYGINSCSLTPLVLRR